MDKKPSKQSSVRVRIAPSPTGPLHIGTARTALSNYLFARKNNGVFILRIEDTDKKRSQKKWEDDIRDGLQWLGLQWQEGPAIGGPHGPYRQSEKKEVYTRYLKKLLKEGKAYYCFCKEEDLEAEREEQIKTGKPVHYPGHCRNLSKKEIKEKRKENPNPVIRFKTPTNQEVVFEDEVRGEVKFNTKELDDFVIAKSLNEPLYNFAVVIDDYEMKITHVIRGEDHLSNTPKQILIREALGLPALRFGHLPLVLGESGGKLSKREAITSVTEYRKKGYLPEALVNFSALLGWHPKDDEEVFSLKELEEKFSLDRVKKGGAVFDYQKLNWMNGIYIREKTVSNLTNLCIPYLIKAGYIEPSDDKYKEVESGEEVSRDYLESIISIYQDRLKYLEEIKNLTAFIFEDINYDKELLVWKNQDDKELLKMLKKSYKDLKGIKEWTQEKITDTVLKEANKLNDRGKILWPLRVALTGKKNSAGPFEVAYLLGQKKALSRIKKARQKIKNK